MKFRIDGDKAQIGNSAELEQLADSIWKFHRYNQNRNTKKSAPEIKKFRKLLAFDAMITKLTLRNEKIRPDVNSPSTLAI